MKANASRKSQRCPFTIAVNVTTFTTVQPMLCPLTPGHVTLLCIDFPTAPKHGKLFQFPDAHRLLLWTALGAAQTFLMSSISEVQETRLRLLVVIEVLD